MTKLNLGCQIHYFPGWINQDIVGDDPNMKVDMVCDAAALPVLDETADFIYAGHIVEHYFPNTLEKAIAEWYRVLKKGGKLVIVTPDCGSIMRDYASGKLTMEQTWQQLYGRIYDYDRASERHHIAFDWHTLVKMCEVPQGWIMEKLDFLNPPEELVPFMGTHISRGAYQLGIVLRKI